MLTLNNTTFSADDPCIFNAVRVDNKNDVCWVNKLLTTADGILYGYSQYIDQRKRVTDVNLWGGKKLDQLIDNSLNTEYITDERGKPFPLYIYGELLGDNDIHNEHDFTAHYVTGLIAPYTRYADDSMYTLTKEQYNQYIGGIVRKSIISVDWYEEPETQHSSIV